MVPGISLLTFKGLMVLRGLKVPKVTQARRDLRGRRDCKVFKGLLDLRVLRVLLEPRISMRTAITSIIRMVQSGS